MNNKESVQITSESNLEWEFRELFVLIFEGSLNLLYTIAQDGSKECLNRLSLKKDKYMSYFRECVCVRVCVLNIALR